MYRIGFDVGGTKIRVVVIDDNEQVVFWRQYPTLPNADLIYDDIVDLYQHAVDSIQYETHTIGIGIPGNIVRPSYLLEGTNVAEELATRLNHDVRVENDANCFALGESLVGAGSGADSVFGVILGTGVGGGLTVGGKLWQGHSGLAGEWGHSVLFTGGLHCWCGGRGCAEQYLSGRAIEKKYRINSGRDLDAAAIFAENDVVNLFIKHDFFHQLAQGLATLINYYDPEVIVIGGGLSNVDEMYEVLPGLVEPLIFNNALRTRIVKSALGADAGAIGAALLCK